MGEVHFIKKQIVELELHNESDVNAIQSKASYLLQNNIPKLFNQILDKLELGKERLVIPKLTLNIRALNYDDWENELVNQCVIDFKRQVTLLKAKAISSPEFNKKMPHENPSLFNTEEQILEVFFEFLKTGYVESSMNVSLLEQFEQQFVEVIEASDALKYSFNLRLEKCIQTHPTSLIRLFRQFDDAFVSTVFKILWNISDGVFKAVKRQLYLERKSSEIPPNEPITLTKDNIPKPLIEWLNRNQATLQIEAPIQDAQLDQKQFFSLKTEDPAKKSETTSSNSDGLSEVKDDPTLSNKTLHKSTDAGEDRYAEETISTSKNHNNEKQRDTELLLELTGYRSLNTTSNVKEENYSESEDATLSRPDDEFQSYYIANAGLVLSAVFLPAFFEKIGYISESTFNSRELNERAILMLEFLANGQEEAPEYMLMLNKLLCSWPLSTSLNRKVTLTEQEKHEANELLMAMIHHWNKLGNTSVASLQSTFLQRKGVLKHFPDKQEWLLVVERKEGIDLLLDYLPWTISLIKLPWMTQFLRVEWA